MDAPFNRKAYFTELITNLRDQGVFKTYAEPRGKAHPDWPEASKMIHFEDEDNEGRNIAGTSAHMGDEPYKVQTRALMQDENATHLPDGRDVALKVQVTREAIAHFMPEAGFRRYLDDFVAHLDRPGNRAAYAEALVNMRRTMRAQFKRETGEFESLLQHRPTTGDTVRSGMAEMTALKHLDHYPQLVATIAIYQAAHASYLEDLRSYLATEVQMSAEEHDNAMAAVNNDSIDQLKDFVIFPNYMPLVVYAYEHPDRARALGCPRHAGTQIEGGARSEGSWKVPVDHARMSDAIGTAWDVFFTQRVLHTTFKQPQTPVKEVCPAHPHLLHAKDTAVLQDIYSKVIAQDGKLAPFVEEARIAAEALAARNSNPPPR